MYKMNNIKVVCVIDGFEYWMITKLTILLKDVMERGKQRTN